MAMLNNQMVYIYIYILALHSILRHTRCVFPHPLLRKNRCVVVFPHRMLHGWAGKTAGRRRPGGVGREVGRSYQQTW